jgi:ATP-dependent protease HslVU (ClpYQ) peptidase subunit
MTTIVGIQYADKCMVMCDSQVTDGGGRNFNHPSMVKVSKRGQYLIAGAGEVMPCDVAQHIWQPPKPKAEQLKNTYHFMIAEVMPSLRRCLNDNGYNFNEETDNSSEYRFAFLIALNGQLFDISDDLSVTMRSDGYYGVGSGSKYAIGALYAGATPRQALEIAAKNDVYTSAPFLTRYSRRTNGKSASK